MSLLKKLFKSSAKSEPPTPQTKSHAESLFREMPFGGYVFDPTPVVTRLTSGTRTREKLNEASDLVYQAIHQIGAGRELKNSDELAMTALAVADAWREIGQISQGVILLWLANTLYERYSVEYKIKTDRVLAGAGAGSFLVAKVFRILGPNHPTPEQTTRVVDFLNRTTRYIEGCATEQDEKDPDLLDLYKILMDNGIREPLTHDAVVSGYIHFVLQLRHWGEHQRAWEITMENLLSMNFYRKLSEDQRRYSVREFVAEQFPEVYAQVSEKWIDPMEKIIQHTSGGRP